MIYKFEIEFIHIKMSKKVYYAKRYVCLHLYEYTKLQMAKLEHLSIMFVCFAFNVSHISSFQGMKYVEFHDQLYHTLQSKETVCLITFQESIKFSAPA